MRTWTDCIVCYIFVKFLQLIISKQTNKASPEASTMMLSEQKWNMKTTISVCFEGTMAGLHLIYNK